MTGNIPTAPTTDTSWVIKAACRDVDPEVMFPEWSFGDLGGQMRDDYPAEVAHAKTVCAGCPVIAKCRQDALDRQDIYGVRGGLDEQERRAILRGTPNRAHPAQPALLELPGVVSIDGADGPRVELTDAGWAAARVAIQSYIDSLPPRSRGSYPWPRANQRQWVAGIIHRDGHGTPWNRLHGYGEHSSIRKWQTRLEASGHWAAVVAALDVTADRELAGVA